MQLGGIFDSNSVTTKMRYLDHESKLIFNTDLTTDLRRKVYMEEICA